MVSFLHCCEKSIASDRLTHASVTVPPPQLEVLALPPDLDPEYAGLAGTLRLISLGRGGKNESGRLMAIPHCKSGRLNGAFSQGTASLNLT